MTETVTLNIANSNGRKFTIQTENKNYINSIVDVKEGNVITQKDVDILQAAARRNGDEGILENLDLGANEKLKLAKLNGYSERYDLSLSNDKKMLIIKIKETPWYFPNPQLKTIKSDFGIGDGVLVQKGEIPYGNEEVISKRAEPGSTPDGRNTDYDSTELEAGDVIKIPVALVKIQDSPQGFWSRPWF